MDYSKKPCQAKNFNTGMFVYACMFLLGVLLVQQLSALPENSVLLLAFFVVCLCAAALIIAFDQNSNQRAFTLSRHITLSISFILLFLFGFTLSSYCAKQHLSLRLDEKLVAQDIIVSGKISSIPATTDEVQRFEFVVDNHHFPDADPVAVPAITLDNKFPRKIRLSWYYGPAVNAGESWQLQVRLKPPHGFMNPGGFDYEAWLFQHGIDATGYVRKSALTKRLKTASGSILHSRESLSRQLDTIASRHGKTSESSFALVKALAIGDKSSISGAQWRVLANTGTSHLMAISGLHIGLASLFAYFLIRRLVPAFVIKRLPAQHIALLAGLLLAFLYALMAGFSISTQRAMIMLFVLSVMLLIRRNHRPIDSLGFALFMVLLIDPLAVMSAGFWFSFSAVAVIFISLTSTEPVIEPADGDQLIIRTDRSNMDLNNARLFTRLKNYGLTFIRLLRHWVRLQLLISLFLLPLSLFMFQQVSLISPLANLLLIPYVSFLVVPVVLLAIICSFIFSPVAELLFGFAAWLLDIIWPSLSYLSNLPHALWVRGDVDILFLLIVTAVLLLLYYSSGISAYLVTRLRSQLGKNRLADHLFLWSLRLLLCFLLMLLLFPALFFDAEQRFNSAEYQLTVLDVGQGSAAVLQTQNHVLVFDAGAKFSDRLNAGSSVVIPYLLTQNVTHLDRLIISHGDADHIGGAQAIIDKYPEVSLIGQDIEQLHSEYKQVCINGLKWQWDGVDFAFLSPDTNLLSNTGNIKRNDRSCVLKVSSVYGSVLFTGDIEQRTEEWLLNNHQQQLVSDILVVPHHGSLTSSSLVFIKQVNPKIAVISVGYKNRYRLPNKQVMARYEQLNQQQLQTSKSGAITIPVLADTDYRVEQYRQNAAKYWHHIVR